ncbi:hypothetical protein [Bradyrhizobium sp. CCBAU 51627]|uniref:hypothetical protein n=1 Tax=Bradyrhizobium sp. CCBAU 51627 TaxID=1325088 RepID=UPI0023060D1A|nr:hypothetical protein [Bradyrhizobium sp. CCBAU 51627]
MSTLTPGDIAAWPGQTLRKTLRDRVGCQCYDGDLGAGILEQASTRTDDIDKIGIAADHVR